MKTIHWIATGWLLERKQFHLFAIEEKILTDSFYKKNYGMSSF